jgi:hypothetical protein
VFLIHLYQVAFVFDTLIGNLISYPKSFGSIVRDESPFSPIPKFEDSVTITYCPTIKSAIGKIAYGHIVIFIEITNTVRSIIKVSFMFMSILKKIDTPPVWASIFEVAFIFISVSVRYTA